MGMRVKNVIYLFAGVIFALPSLFFTYYTTRLLYLNLTMEDAAAHRTGGMLIGAVAFPLAVIFFGFISFYFFRRAKRGSDNNERAN